MGAAMFAGWPYAVRARLVAGEATATVGAADERRIVVAQALYTLGARLCIVNTYVSIAAIVLVQLNYVIAPRVPQLYRL